MSLSSTARTHMIDSQLRVNEVNDERIIAAVEAVDRENFVPKSKRGIAYVDEDLAISDDRFLMEPMVFARLLVAADIQSDELVLDIGCATGYSSAVISHLADAVVALEEDEALADKAEATLAASDVMNVAVVKGALKGGVAKQGPFDVIIIEGAAEEIPAALVKQLKEGGRLVAVKLDDGVGRAQVTTLIGCEEQTQILFDAAIPALPAFGVEKGFVF